MIFTKHQKQLKKLAGATASTKSKTATPRYCEVAVYQWWEM